MKRKMSAYQSVAFVFLVTLKSSFGESIEKPYVAWTMDNRSQNHLYPELISDSRWVGDLTSLVANFSGSVFDKGIRGDAIYVNSTAFKLANNLSASECVMDVTACTEGMSVSLWLKVLSLGRHTHGQKPILQSKFCNNGFHIAITNTSLILRFSKNSITVSTPLQEYGWTNVGLSWHPSEKGQDLAVYLNGSEHKGNNIGVGENCSLPDARFGDLVVGSDGGAIFLLDELKIYYSVLSFNYSTELFATTGGISATTDLSKTGEYTYVIVLATAIPAAAVILCLSVAYFVIRRRRARISFHRYIRQSSTNLAAKNFANVDSDAAEDHTDLDSEGELEKLQHWLIRVDHTRDG